MYEGPKLVIYPGGMGGQKTAYAILDLQRIRDGTHYGFKAFKPKNSEREGIDLGKAKLISRAGPTIEAITVPEDQPERILDLVGRKDIFVLIDEAHMFNSNLQKVVDTLLSRRNVVHAAFLINDYGDRVFPNAAYLMSQADECTGFYHGICKEPGCRNKGVHSQLLVIEGRGKKKRESLVPYHGKKNIISGDIKGGIKKVQYRPRCHDHYVRPENHPDFKEEKR